MVVVSQPRPLFSLTLVHKRKKSGLGCETILVESLAGVNFNLNLTSQTFLYSCHYQRSMNQNMSKPLARISFIYLCNFCWVQIP